MRKVEEFVSRVYADVEENAAVEDLKLEMETYLYKSIADLMQEGKTEEEATNLALRRFAAEEELRTVLKKMFPVQDRLSKWMGYAAWLILSLSVLGLLSLQFITPPVTEVSQIQEEIMLVAERQRQNLPKLQQTLKTIAAENPSIKEIQLDAFDSTGEEISMNAEDYEILSGVENLETLFYYRDDFFLPLSLVSSTLGTSAMAINVSVVHYGILGNLISSFGMGAAAVLFAISRIVRRYHSF